MADNVKIYEFSVDWFSTMPDVWLKTLPKEIRSAKKILEIGSYEGRSAVWLFEHLLNSEGGELYCIDTWEGGIEHNKSAMNEVERRFDKNAGIVSRCKEASRLIKLKGESKCWLANLIAGGHINSFDLVYVDGSHQAADVLVDLVSAFHLCRVGGIIICDDYLWDFGANPIMTPKLAVDAFTNCFSSKISILRAPLYQLFFTKRLP